MTDPREDVEEAEAAEAAELAEVAEAAEEAEAADAAEAAEVAEVADPGGSAEAGVLAPVPSSRDSEGPRLSRRAARTRALEVLFAADVRDALPSTVLDAEPHVDPFTRRLVDVVIANRPAVDALIALHAQGWALDRMPAVDRSVLRLATAEMLYVEDVPPKVAVDEAVELAKSLSTDASPKFVNGVLAAIARASDLF